MPNALRVAFWNVENLFEPGAVERGPQSAEELERKTAQLASVINQCFNGEGPDFLGLAEVGTRRIFDDLTNRLQGGPFHQIWEDAGMPDQTGLGCIARSSVCARLDLVNVQRPSIFARPRSVIVRAELHGLAEPVLMVVNHWKSRMPSPPGSDEDDRRGTADWLGQLLSTEHRLTSVVVMGDFNAEPQEPVFGELRLRATRFFSTALWSQATPAYLYNCSWRWLAEPDTWENASMTDYREPRPKTTHGEGKASVIDHVMVSGRVLRNGPLTLEETSVGCVVIDGVTSRHLASGKLIPRRWSYSSHDEFSGASDHFPIIASFSMR